MIETELCAYGIEACRAAARAGLTRVELCASPYEGGTTPSAAAIRQARRIGGVRLSVMIRPRGGDFLYTDVPLAARVGRGDGCRTARRKNRAARRSDRVTGRVFGALAGRQRSRTVIGAGP